MIGKHGVIAVSSCKKCGLNRITLQHAFVDLRCTLRVCAMSGRVLNKTGKDGLPMAVTGAYIHKDCPLKHGPITFSLESE